MPPAECTRGASTGVGSKKLPNLQHQPGVAVFEVHTPQSATVSAILSTTYSDTGFREALSFLDDRPTGVHPRRRRRIRLDILKDVINTDGAILDNFMRVAKQLSHIQIVLTRLSKGYEEMRSRIERSHCKISPALTDAASLFQQQNLVEAKQRTLVLFRNSFIMPDDEIDHLRVNSVPIDERFFMALSRASRICEECHALLGFENQIIGTELMEQTSRDITAAYHKLYTYVHRELRTLNLESPVMNSFIRQALRTLAERPSLFRQSLEFFVEARERVLTDAFQIALAGGGTSREVNRAFKPIDLVAHDPIRYAGDMFAWVHSTAVTELEAVDALFVSRGDEPGGEIESDSGVEPRQFSINAEVGDFLKKWAIGDLVDRDMAGVSRILRQRVEQVIHSNEEAITACKLVVLITFYGVTLQKLVGEKSNLLDGIDNLKRQASRQFRALVKDNVSIHLTELQHVPPDLGPPVGLHDTLSQLETLMEIYQSSYSARDAENDCTFILSEAFHPCMSACISISTALNHPANSIFIINCNYVAEKVLQSFVFTRREAATLRDEISREADKLITYQTNVFRQSSGLDRLIVRQDVSKDFLKQEVLQQVSQRLDNFLPSALVDAMERLDHILDKKLSRQITEAASQQFFREFELLEANIEQIDEQITEPTETRLRSYFPRTAAEIRVLLS
ncbi:hypothetical protein L249_7411 [Ophiocordyceps polyrhachis-furcata BCC 54312]|uniref:Conserved oligomeric Golgi complex subunit 6 n=1 Tax=Ophiocordyceps polyrhachis-furcata BCC 54312 TaxID=1330021 RepID=A0A367LAQ9_9HYPO|nr:hypothetical protein L249_7411 [Ophiocordyceps polyrhachis-furcata BCC 54312]